MQILHAGDVVRARCRTWRVTDVRSYDLCRAVALAGTGVNTGASCVLLTPFDHIEPVARPSTTPRRVSTGRWRCAARHLIGRSGLPGLLQTPSAAEIDVLPHQLEPAVAVMRGDGCRLLLADEVGLGKTIQACLLIAELRARAAAERVLILTPPGLRDQWREELARRFHIDAAIADAHAVRGRAADLPPDIDPWSTWPIAIASIDYVKRPEVLRAVLNSRWDIVVVDEAHQVANDGDRRRAAQALASRAGYVVLLTATPHSGDAAAFESLCRLGSHGERLLTFRRTRLALSSAVSRRIHRLHVRATPAEHRMRARFDAFARAVRAERDDGNRDMWIALALLRKRAFSSAHALYLSVMRRLDVLAGAAPSVAQLLLPLDDEGELADDDEAPAWQPVLGLRDADRERRLLTALSDAAAACARAESKLAAVRRLLRRVREPIIIFTEYRDTLAHLARSIAEPATLLHGGLTRTERAAALESFTAGRSRVLLATDAASEGLNLHHCCRAVINLELPWNPMRLEQRIGRVDRIGQARTVHAFHLVGAHTGELGLLDDLRERIAHARAEIGAPDPLYGALSGETVPPLRSDQADVETEVRRLHLARALPAQPPPDTRPLVARTRHRLTRARLGTRRLSLWECAIEDGSGRVVASRLIATTGARGDSERTAAEESAATWRFHAVDTMRRFAATGIERAGAITEAIETDAAPLLQPGLFDRRAHFAGAALKAAHDEAVRSQAERRAALQLSAQLTVGAPRLRLVLVAAP